MSPRLIKTHLALELLPAGLLTTTARVIYVSRNPRDAVVSFYHHWRILEGFTGSFDTFFQAFIGDVCGYYSPFMLHNLSYWERRHQVDL